MSGAAELGQLGSVVNVDSTTGNVGIGKTPLVKLDVNGSGNFVGDVLTVGSFLAKNSTVSTIYLRNLSGVNRFDSYNDPISATYPLAINASDLKFNIADTTKLQIDSGGNILNVSSGGLGYGTGSGGTVTQITSKSTGVTLNKTNGQIVMNGAALASAARVGFVFTNSTIASTDTLALNITSSFQTYRTDVYVGSGTAAIYITNLSGGSLSEAVVINFAVIKAVTA